MIVKHSRIASMSVQTSEIRQLAKNICDNVVLDDEAGETTAITHYPDGRIKVHCDGDGQKLADEINGAGGFPNTVEPVQERRFTNHTT